MASAVAVAATAYVPPHMELPATGWKDIGAGTLVTLEFKSKVTSALEGGETSLVSETACMSAADVISKHSGKNGCIAFAVRRPG